MIIYKVTNIINGKIYIGQTKQRLPRRRTIHHNEAKSNRSPNSAFHKAIRKYGKKAFEWEVLCECDSFDDMNEKEIFYIKEYDSYVKEHGYNMTYGGDGTLGHKPSEETRKKMSESSFNKGKPGFFRDKKHTKESIEKSKRYGVDNGNSKKWLLTNPDGIQLCVIGLLTFCKENGLHDSLLRKVAWGQRSHHKGWKMEEINE